MNMGVYEGGVYMGVCLWVCMGMVVSCVHICGVLV